MIQEQINRKDPFVHSQTIKMADFGPCQEQHHMLGYNRNKNILEFRNSDQKLPDFQVSSLVFHRDKNSAIFSYYVGMEARIEWQKHRVEEKRVIFILIIMSWTHAKSDGRKRNWNVTFVIPSYLTSNFACFIPKTWIWMFCKLCCHADSWLKTSSHRWTNQKFVIGTE